jgi:hypothetical protein
VLGDHLLDEAVEAVPHGQAVAVPPEVVSKNASGSFATIWRPVPRPVSAGSTRSIRGGVASRWTAIE